MTLTDDIAIEALKSGNDEKAFAWIFNAYFRQLCIRAETMVASSETAEDLVQDVFEVLWKNREKINITTSLERYLYWSVRNACLNYIAHANVEREYMERFLKENSEASDCDNPASKLEAKEMKRSIYAAIDSFPVQCREIALLSFKEGLRNDEIAAKLHISVDTVKAQIYRARTKLRKIIEYD